MGQAQLTRKQDLVGFDEDAKKAKYFPENLQERRFALVDGLWQDPADQNTRPLESWPAITLPGTGNKDALRIRIGLGIVQRNEGHDLICIVRSFGLLGVFVKFVFGRLFCAEFSKAFLPVVNSCCTIGRVLHRIGDHAS